MVLIDAISIMWLVAFIVWGYVLGQLLALAVDNWWRVRRAVSEWWGNLPVVANLRIARAQEEFNWWWVNSTPDERARYRASIETLAAMTRDLSEAIAAIGISFQEATEAFSAAFVPYPESPS